MIDIGLNLASEQFNKDREIVIKNAFSKNVSGFILTGTSAKASENVLELSKQNIDTMRCTAGVHPHDAKSWNTSKAIVEKLIKDEIVIAVGECGLDYDRMYSTKEEQQLAFKEQLEIAEKSVKPVFLHVRNAPGKEKEIMDDFLKIFKPYHERGVRGVVHCFTGSSRMLQSFIGLGLYIGITGWVCDDKRGKDLQNLIRYIPNDKLMIETDAPYLTPKNMPKDLYQRRNEPAFLGYVLEKIAELKRMDNNKLIEITNDNVERLFGWRPNK